MESSRLECNLLERGGNRAKTVGVPQHVHLAEFCKRLGIKETEPTAQALFSIFEEVFIWHWSSQIKYVDSNKHSCNIFFVCNILETKWTCWLEKLFVKCSILINSKCTDESNIGVWISCKLFYINITVISILNRCIKLDFFFNFSKIYDESGEGRLNEESVKLALSHCAGLSHEEGSAAFLQTDMDERNWVTAGML